MFTKSKTMAKGAELDSGSRNHIAQGTSIKGDVTTNGDIRIDGELEGTVHSKGKVVVGNTGRIKGTVRCQNANVSGSVEGNMTVSEMLSVQASGKFSGELAYGKLAVEPGAQLEGTFTIAGKLKEISASDARSKQTSEKTA